ncbi:hypothetical protein PUG81_09075 [Erwiniaceae bacterium L1_54_6]|jgi:hypothetical protein|uniref:hypothetical protein n=1 Tax=Pantoea cypripedii TaxID=55209 RepID=UPI001ABFE9AE|nr:hypothetical protein [Pantoea cypripedii]MDF7659120.1 hypothetical protein [Erwiniaceae bacterium L1_54_6]
MLLPADQHCFLQPELPHLLAFRSLSSAVGVLRQQHRTTLVHHFAGGPDKP